MACLITLLVLGFVVFVLTLALCKAAARSDRIQDEADASAESYAVISESTPDEYGQL